MNTATGEAIAIAVPSAGAGLAPADERHPNADSLLAAGQIPPRQKNQLVDLDRDAVWTEKTRHLIDCHKRSRDLMAALIGPRGTGKTQAAVELMRSACKRGHSVLYTTAMLFFARIKATYQRDAGATELDVINEFCKPDLLVIDEVQVRSESSWENNLLTHLVDTRYGRMLGTLFIGNLSPDSFRECVGDSIHSRLAQTGGIFVFNGNSFRSQHGR